MSGNWPVSKTAHNEVTGDRLVSKSSETYRENYENVFKHSIFELNKKLKVQFPDLYWSGSRVCGVIDEMLQDVENSLKVLISTGNGSIMKVDLKLD